MKSAYINVDDTAKEVDRANDSFEKNETSMMAEVNEDEESVLANSFFDSTTAEMTSAIPRLKNDTILSENANNTILDVTITMPKAEDSVLADLIDSLSLIIENNIRTVKRYLP